MSYPEQLKEMELKRQQFKLRELILEVNRYKCNLIIMIILFIAFALTGGYGFDNHISIPCVVGYMLAGMMSYLITDFYREYLRPALQRKKLHIQIMHNEDNNNAK